MIDLAIVVYLIDVLLKLSKMLWAIIYGYCFIAVALGACTGITHIICEGETKEYTILFFKTLKKSLFFIIPMLMVFVAIPSERNMYIIAGLYAGDKVVNAIAESEVAKQAERTLTAKLKEMENEYLANVEKGGVVNSVNDSQSGDK